MALPHAQPGDVVPVLPGVGGESSRTHALFKARDLEVIRVMLQAGDHMPPHKVPGEITVQCLVGRLEIGHPGGFSLLAGGEMTYLAGGALHDVRALEDSVALVTIALAPEKHSA
jgi:quercetin dioxygenase-like cupin family protein